MKSLDNSLLDTWAGMLDAKQSITPHIRRKLWLIEQIKEMREDLLMNPMMCTTGLIAAYDALLSIIELEEAGIYYEDDMEDAA